jgi:NADH:ubiquinone oxidoreductase subunit 6 (subunit J)
MGLLLVLAVVGAIIVVVAMAVHALRADPSPEQHGWLVIVPLLILWLFILMQLLI